MANTAVKGGGGGCIDPILKHYSVYVEILWGTNDNSAWRMSVGYQGFLHAHIH